jgi:hypothetical protein
VRAPTEGKARSRKRPLKLTPAEIAEIDELIKIGRWQHEQERQRLLRHDEEELQRLIEQSPKTPWPKQVGPGPTSGRDGFLYVREEEEGLQLAHVVEVARRDGVVRYALAPGDPKIDLDRHWERRDPSWQFVMDRLKGVKPDDVDRVIDEAIERAVRQRHPAEPEHEAVHQGGPPRARGPETSAAQPRPGAGDRHLRSGQLARELVAGLELHGREDACRGIPRAPMARGRQARSQELAVLERPGAQRVGAVGAEALTREKTRETSRVAARVGSVH